MRTAIVAFAFGMWFMPPPDGLTLQAWRLFAVFATAIVVVVLNVLPILTASVLAVAASVLSGLRQDANTGAADARVTAGSSA